jgi:hypothetical protein
MMSVDGVGVDRRKQYRIPAIRSSHTFCDIAIFDAIYESKIVRVFAQMIQTHHAARCVI